MPIGIRGGWRQRLEQSAASSADAISARQPHGHLATRVLQMWSWGQISAPAVQYIMEGARLDGSTDPATLGLSKIGSGGLWQQNCQRDICRNFFRDIKIPSTYLLDVLATDAQDPLDPVVVPTHILLPHQVFLCYATSIPKSWRQALGLHRVAFGASGTGRSHLAIPICMPIHFWIRAMGGRIGRFHLHYTVMVLVLPVWTPWKSSLGVCCCPRSVLWRSDLFVLHS